MRNTFVVAVAAAVGMVSVCVASRGDDSRKPGLSVGVRGAFAISKFLLNPPTYNDGSWLAGVNADWCFNMRFCTFVSAEVLERGYRSLNSRTAAKYIDSTAGIVWRGRGSLISDSSMETFRLGLFYAAPTKSNLDSLAPSTELASFFGASIGGESIFPITSGFGLGFSIWSKFGFDATVKTVQDPAFGLYGGLVGYFF